MNKELEELINNLTRDECITLCLEILAAKHVDGVLIVKEEKTRESLSYFFGDERKKYETAYNAGVAMFASLARLAAKRDA